MTRRREAAGLQHLSKGGEENLTGPRPAAVEHDSARIGEVEQVGKGHAEIVPGPLHQGTGNGSIIEGRCDQDVELKPLGRQAALARPGNGFKSPRHAPYPAEEVEEPARVVRAHCSCVGSAPWPVPHTLFTERTNIHNTMYTRLLQSVNGSSPRHTTNHLVG